MARNQHTDKRVRAALAVAAAASVAVVGAVFATQAQAASSNLLTNGSFSSGNLNGWTCDSGTGSVVTSPVYSGDTYALAGAATSSDDAQCTQTVSVQPNSSYSLSGEFEGAYVYLGVTGGSDTWTPSATSWQQLSMSFTTSASQTSVTIYTHGWYAQGTYYADNLTLTGAAGSGSTSTSPSPTPTTASPSPSPTTTTASPTPTSTGGTGGNSGLPAHVLAGYWQDFTNTAPALSLASVPTGYNLVDVAFASTDSANDGGVTYSVDSGLSSALGGYTDAQFTADVATLHSRGQKVLLSIGGQNGTISVASSSAATNFANSAYSLMKQYGFDGVDIDLENGVTPTYMAQALQDLHNLAGSSLIITLAPQTIDMQSTGSDYFALALDIKSILTISFTQYYNSGTMNGCDGNVYAEATENFVTALACTQFEGGLSQSQVGIGLPATSAAGPDGGYVSPSTVNAELDCLAAKANCGSFVPPSAWPGIGGAMDWSINWDASSGYAFANTVGPYLKSLP
ncbi:glycosyl hydrolase family 18 protein [Actinospica sp.]|jgi:chitinase|uniref:glycosyl hydrolase family 18 protein n=1 Tax=Actinospica sp. TaxID=1872142 RepID=UPI002CD3F33D|nr:glycosyl hydrolase family 18 protein [Actinospica sp.]HWG25356.1 glycosyl hydrolase family 18 protein [Actinospica sp.]